MSEYVERSIREALKISKGDTLKASKQIVRWCFEDDRLLQEITKPHLSGIIAYNVERVASGRSDKAKQLKPLKNSKTKAPKDKFGMEILKAVVDSDATVFGFEDRPASRRGASKEHVDAIRKLVSKSKNKKDK